MLSTVLERLEENVAASRRRENWKPFHNRTSHEVGAIWVVNAVAAAHSGYALAKQSFEDKCVPKLELGNEGRLGTRGAEPIAGGGNRCDISRSASTFATP
jgi:hypothetical protein